jgi:predicted DNA-binding transcriptional regulator YafY
MLATAISAGAPVTIEYVNGDGHASTRLIEPVELDRHLLTAFCHLRGEERMFALDRIEAVARP